MLEQRLSAEYGFHRPFVKENGTPRCMGGYRSLSSKRFIEISRRRPGCPDIKTTIANRLTWFASHDSRAGADVSKEGRHEFLLHRQPRRTMLCPAPAGRAVSPRSFSRSFLSASFVSQSRQSVLPSETGNPQEAHFSTRSIVSGTEAEQPLVTTALVTATELGGRRELLGLGDLWLRRISGLNELWC